MLETKLQNVGNKLQTWLQKSPQRLFCLDLGLEVTLEGPEGHELPLSLRHGVLHGNTTVLQSHEPIAIKKTKFHVTAFFGPQKIA